MTTKKIIKLIDKEDKSLFSLSEQEKKEIVNTLSFTHLYYLSKLNTFFSIENFIDYQQLNTFIEKNEYKEYLLKENSDFFGMPFIFKNLNIENQQQYLNYILASKSREVTNLLIRNEIHDGLLNCNFFDFLSNIENSDKSFSFFSKHTEFKNEIYSKFLNDKLLSRLSLEEATKIKLSLFILFSNHCGQTKNDLNHIDLVEKIDSDFCHDRFNKKSLKEVYDFYLANVEYLSKELEFTHYPNRVKVQIIQHIQPASNILKYQTEPLEIIKEILDKTIPEILPIILKEKLNKSLDNLKEKKHSKKI